MGIITYLVLGYIVPLVVTRKLLRDWMIKDEAEPSLEYVFFAILPLLNIIAVLVLVVANGEKLAKKLAKQFFRIK